MRGELALLQIFKNLCGFGLANHGSQTHCNCIGLRHHDFQTARNYFQHEVFFAATVQHPVMDLLDDPNPVIRIDNLVPDLEVHDSPVRMNKEYPKEHTQSRYFVWNQRVKEGCVSEWHFNCYVQFGLQLLDYNHHYANFDGGYEQSGGRNSHFGGLTSCLECI